MKEFEKEIYFEGCMPIEVMAKRGRQTVLFGPMKPVGLVNPHTGELPHAVVQLRQDNAAGTLYNMVGFQTHLKWGEQKRVFSLIPGLENAEFVRYGVMHRNTFINSPRLLKPTYQFRNRDNLFFCRTDDRGGRICGIGCFRLDRRHERSALRQGGRMRRIAGRYGIRQYGAVYYDGGL